MQSVEISRRYVRPGGGREARGVRYNPGRCFKASLSKIEFLCRKVDFGYVGIVQKVKKVKKCARLILTRVSGRTTVRPMGVQ